MWCNSFPLRSFHRSFRCALWRGNNWRVGYSDGYRKYGKQIMIMQDYKTTVLVSTPSYAIALADRIEQLGVDPKSLSLKFGLFGGEPWSEKMREEIESRLLLSATDNYGLSEVIGPGVAGECSCKKVCIFMKTRSSRRLLIPKQARYCHPAARVNWCLPRLPKKPFP